MDSLTHIVLGAAIGEAVLGKKIGRKAMLWGALADTIPDFDVFAYPCVSDAQQLLVHRGITHSFFFIILMAPLLGWLFSKWFKKSEVSWKQWTLLFFLGMFTHVLIDSMTSYGTGWFEPFSSYRVSFNTIFVADPFYTIPFLVCVLIALILLTTISPVLMVKDIVLILVFVSILGLSIGYYSGACIAGVLLVIDKLRVRFRAPSIKAKSQISEQVDSED